MKGGATSAFSILLSLVLVWIGCKSLDTAVKRSNQEAAERKKEAEERGRRDAVIIALMAAVAEKQGVDTSALLKKGGE